MLSCNGKAFLAGVNDAILVASRAENSFSRLSCS